jgi:hypothetical protein
MLTGQVSGVRLADVGQPNPPEKIKKEGRMMTLARAIATSKWKVAALFLLIGLMEELSRIPAGSIEGVLDLLEGEDGEKAG